MTIALAFIALYVGHVVGDHVAQTDYQATRKAGQVGAMLGHVLSYGACQFAALLLLRYAAPGFDPPTWQLAAGMVFSLATHWFIDLRWPVIWLQEHTGSAAFVAEGNPMNGRYLTDQTLHIAALFIAALIVGWGL